MSSKCEGGRAQARFFGNEAQTEDDKILLSTHLHWLDGAAREMRTPWMFTAGGAGFVFNMGP